MLKPFYDYVLFDWDGCLAQTLDVWMTAFEVTYIDYGVNPGRSVIAANFGDWGSAKRFGITDDDHEKFHATVFERVTMALPSVELYPGVSGLLGDLRAGGARLGLVSSSEPEHLKMAMQRHDIAKHFDAIVTIRDVTHHKPHPEPLELALAKLGGSKKRAVMVGDSTKDLGAAKNAGMDSILVFSPEHELFYDIETLKGFDPTYICMSFAEMREILLVAD